MPQSKHRSLSALALYWLFITGFFSLLFIGFLSQLDWGFFEESSDIPLITLSAFDNFLLEVLLVMLIGGLCIQGNFLFRLIAYFIALIFFLVNVLQAAFFYQTGAFISKLATENMNHVAILLNFQNTALVCLSVFLFAIFVYLVEKRKTKNRSLKYKTIGVLFSFLTVSLVITIANVFDWWSAKHVNERDAFLAHHQLRHHSPTWSLYDILFVQSADKEGVMTPRNISIAQQYGFYFQQGAEYPLVKKTIYSGAEPFPQKSKRLSEGDFKKEQPNIIVFFAEGYSARTTNVYGSEYKDITPNLSDFSKHSMVVDNYFNHTAATYRGLHGQLCSIFPKHGGFGNFGGWETNYADLVKTDYFCLSHLLGNYDYQTYFLLSQFRAASFIDEMMGVLGFDQVWAADSLAKNYLKGQEILRRDAITDQQLFVGLIGLLKDLEQQQTKDQNDKRPFFISLYNFETHTLFDVFDDGKRYGNGDNESLNTIHNLDNAFGLFWKYYQQSEFAENTIVIFTTDHSHFFDKSYVEAVKKPGSNYQSLLTDQIPLIIHDPTRSLPGHFDAHYASSIDFTPSLVHYLALANHENAFIGNSIFEDKTQQIIPKGKESGVASIGILTYLIDQKKIHGGGNFEGPYEEDLTGLNGFINHLHWLEGENRIWNVNLNKSIKQKINGQVGAAHH